MEITPPSSLADNSQKARDAQEQYSLALDFCLAREDWSFARKLISLPVVNLPTGEVADPDLPYLHQLPPDLVKFLFPKDRDIKWREDAGGLLRTDTAGTKLVFYTRRAQDETKLPATFQTLVSLTLALRLAPTYSITRAKRKDMNAALDDTLSLAKQEDASSASPQQWDGEDAASDWVSEVTR
ncbi:MAG: hypothetical protein CML69_10855 [Rhodobacteraceae bacterium]|nr:hypothetical protein [Paracoccaceae bacterium]